MQPFLSQVASHYFGAGDISNLCFVFPNRRSLVFFRKYLSEEVAKSGKAIFEPALYTMNDFFYEIAGVKACDQVFQLLRLYSCYSELYPNPESLDEFIFWGGILLSDFNDIDKYLVNPESLFTNVRDFRSLQDNYEYLDSEQLKAIEKFVSNFTTGGTYKDAFLKVWNILLPLYKSFNKSLLEDGYSYEGQVYRNLAERLKNESVVDILKIKSQKFIFVGLNALNECEKSLLRSLRNAKLAEFCWDYSSEWIRNKANKSSFFLDKNIEDFPSAFKLDEEGLSKPEINVLSIPSSVGQAKQLPQILNQIGAKGIETAIVIPDETLLLPVLNSIPEDIRNINVTMGYPLGDSALWTLFNDISALQLHLRLKGDKWHFYHKYLRNIFSNSIIKTIADENDKKLIDNIIDEAQYYIPEDRFADSSLLRLIFQAIVKDTNSTELVPQIIEYQRNVVFEIAKKISQKDGMAMELDFARDIYLVLGRIEAYSLKVLPTTYLKLLGQLLSHASVPFKGEPLSGLQIMGPLETRALDFENLIILSCNEDVFPRRNSSSSFIPPELRKGFGLPTYEYQDAVWAYYFYRMIQRSKTVWMLYDSRTEGVRNGEESRYIKQLSLHFGANIHRYVAKATIMTKEEDNPNHKPIAKTAEMIESFKETKNLSASSLYTYLCCQAKFYYSYILGLEASKEVAENLDGSMLGTVFHNTMEFLYKEDRLTKDMLETYLKGNLIEEEVEKNILKELNTMEVVGKNLIYKDTIARYVRQAIKRDIELIDSKGLDYIEMKGREKFVRLRINDYNFVGFVDRLDSVDPGIIRIIDYKTGNGDYDFDLEAILKPEIAQNIFGEDNSLRDKVALQLYLYEKMIKHEMPHSEFELSIYHTRRLFTEAPSSVRIPESIKNEMDAQLVKRLDELSDLSIPFSRAEDKETCKYCDFQIICGRC